MHVGVGMYVSVGYRRVVVFSRRQGGSVGAREHTHNLFVSWFSSSTVNFAK